MESLPRLALIHGEPDQLISLLQELGSAGLCVRCADDVGAGFDLVRTWNPQVVLLDATMPGIDGISLLPLLRLHTQAPIVMLSPRDDPQERVASLAVGADFHVSLPCEISELVALLRAALKRPALRDPASLIFSDLAVNVRTRTATRSGKHVDLTRREFDVLVLLLREPGRVFTREEILGAVWRDKPATPGAVDTCVAGLRKKVDAPFETAIIQTIHGVGFAVRQEILKPFPGWPPTT